MPNFRTAIGLYGLDKLAGGGLPAVIAAAAQADRLGIAQVVLTDHVVMGERTDRYPYGKFPARPSTPWFEPMVTLGGVASATTRIRLSTSVLIGPLRPAVLLAKQAATLDQLSRGRLDLGLGTGWQREEFDASGIPFAGRGLRLEEQVRACRLLWRGEATRFTGETLRLENIHCQPVPVQSELPLWFGIAPTEAGCRRIAELGTGWLPIGQPPKRLAVGVAKLRAAFERAGRDPGELEVRVQLPPVMGSAGPDLEATLAGAQAFLEAGATVLETLPFLFCRDAAELEPVLERISQLGA